MSSRAERVHRSHEPVLLQEVLYWLRPGGGGKFVDCTVGLGGHAEALLAASPDTMLIGIDRDPAALELASNRLAKYGDRFKIAHANFKELPAVLTQTQTTTVRGILVDLGVSALQLEKGERGFSFLQDAPLDMRMDQSSGQTAAGLLKRIGERELSDLIFAFGEERQARRIARAIVRERQKQPILTTRQLAGVVVRALNVSGRWRIHPATRTFQALRIAVNRELEGLDEFISDAISALEPGGRLAVISFHSLEDRIVKDSFRRESGECICGLRVEPRMRAVPPQSSPAALQKRQADEGNDAVCTRCGARHRVIILTRKPIKPSSEEIERNPRSRSSRLRVCEKI